MPFNLGNLPLLRNPLEILPVNLRTRVEVREDEWFVYIDPCLLFTASRSNPLEPMLTWRVYPTGEIEQIIPIVEVPEGEEPPEGSILLADRESP